MLRVPCIAAILCFALCAQTPDTATLRGRVVDPAGAAIAGAQVTGTNTFNQAKRTAVTDDEGSFSLAGLPVAGEYDIQVVKAPFVTEQIHNLRL